jgi:hypothetical protein
VNATDQFFCLCVFGGGEELRWRCSDLASLGSSFGDYCRYCGEVVVAGVVVMRLRLMSRV